MCTPKGRISLLATQALVVCVATGPIGCGLKDTYHAIATDLNRKSHTHYNVSWEGFPVTATVRWQFVDYEQFLDVSGSWSIEFANEGSHGYSAQIVKLTFEDESGLPLAEHTPGYSERFVDSFVLKAKGETTRKGFFEIDLDVAQANEVTYMVPMVQFTTN